MSLIKDATDNRLSYEIIGIAMDIHNKLGPGLKEQVYQRAFESELKHYRIECEPQKQIEIYSGKTRIGMLFIDLFVDNRMVVELKALSHMLTNNETAQVISYLKVLNCKTGLLFNYGRKYLQYKRILPPRSISPFDEKDLRYGIKFRTAIPKIDKRSNKPIKYEFVIR